MHDLILFQEGKEMTLDNYVQTLIDKASHFLQDKRNHYVATQALWDGDTNGWGLYLELVCKLSSKSTLSQTVFVPVGKSIEDFKSDYATNSLAYMRFGSDMQLFNGIVPPYPESWVAEQVGKALEKQYGLPFYFPSPNEANDNCPNWWEQDLGIHCADCGKLVMPSNSPYAMKEVCYHCQLKREWNERIIKDESKMGDITLHAKMIEGSAMHGAGKDGLTYKIMSELFRKDTPENRKEGVIWVTTLEIKACLPMYEQWLQTQLEAYFDNPTEEQSQVNLFKKSMSRGFFLGYVQTYTFECMGKKYEIELSRLGKLAGYIQWKEVLENSQEFIIIFYDFVTYRDTSFTQLLRGNEGLYLENFKEHFQKILPETEIEKCLNKLVSNNFVNYKNGIYTLTQKGYYI